MKPIEKCSLGNVIGNSVRRKPGFRFYGFLGFALVLASLNFIPYHPVKNDPCVLQWEKYDELLAKEVNSMNKLIAAADAHAIINKVPVGSVAYWDNLSEIIRNSFSHGYSYYSMQENWVAASLGAIVWDDLAAIVEPNDIMKYPNAACSQQSIILMECFRRKGIPSRAVLFDHHYAVEAYIDNSWRFFDNNLEISLPGKSHVDSYEGYVQKGQLSSIYGGILSPKRMEHMLGNVHYGPVSAEPAPVAKAFHMGSRILSLTLWMLPFGMALLNYWSDRKRNRLAEARLLLRRDRQARRQQQPLSFPELWKEMPEFA